MPVENQSRAIVRNFLAGGSLLVMAACASPEASRPASRIDVQQAVGFTIVEEASVDGEVRLDYQEAVSLLEQGRLAEGIAALDSIAAAAPGLSAPQIDLGIARHRSGDLAAAELHLLRALELNPEHPTAHNELGIVYRKQGRFAEAREAYEAALAVYPGFHFARRNLAVLCDLYLADTACALENYQAYMETVPGDDEASMWITDLRHRAGR